MHVVFFCTDIPPIAGLPTSGTALRSHGLIEGFRHHGHTVTVSVPRLALTKAREQLPKLTAALKEEEARSVVSALAELEKYAFDFDTQLDLVISLAPDAIVCGHWPALMFSRDTLFSRTQRCPPIVVDLAGPHLLERTAQAEGDAPDALEAKINNLANADYFIVSGARQLQYFNSFLFRAGIPNPHERACTVVMPLPPQDLRISLRRNSPADDGRDYPRFIFAGIFLPWQNPAWALRKLTRLLEMESKGQLQIIGGKHPHYQIPGGIYDSLVKELSQSRFVHSENLLPYDQLTQRLVDMDVAIDLMEWNLERELAVTIRSTTYLWSGLPVIYNDYSDLSDLINKYDAGWTITPGDDHSFENTVSTIFSDPLVVREKSINAERLADQEFSWDIAVKPVLALIEKHLHASTITCQPTRDSQLSGFKRLKEFDLSEATAIQLLVTPHNITPPKITVSGIATTVRPIKLAKSESAIQWFVCRLDNFSELSFLCAPANLSALGKDSEKAIQVLDDWLEISLHRLEFKDSSLNFATQFHARSEPAARNEVLHNEVLQDEISIAAQIIRPTQLLNGMFTLPFSPQRSSAGRLYRLTIRSLSSLDVLLPTCSALPYPYLSAKLDGAVIDKSFPLTTCAL